MLLRAKIAVAAACLIGLTVSSLYYLTAKITVLETSGRQYFAWIRNGISLNIDLFNKVKGILVDIGVLFVLPFLIIVPLTVGTIWILVRQDGAMQAVRGGGRNTKDNAATVTLVAIIITFIVLRGPWMVEWAILITGVYSLSSPNILLLAAVTRSAMIFNPIGNFIVFFFTGRTFRQRLKQVCCRYRLVTGKTSGATVNSAY